MKLIIKTLIILFCIGNSYSQSDSLKIEKLEFRYKQLENKIDQTRQNQLNYKLEKDLLKEAYSRNYERIQLIITLLIGIFSVIGFLGLKNIWKLKNSYETELKELQILKIKIEKDYDSLIKKQEKLNEKIEIINKTNKVQNSKLHILEIKEEIDRLIDNKEYFHALEYINIGLKMEPQSISLLQNKSFVFFKLKRYKESIKVHQEILEFNPGDEYSINEFAELLLIVNDNEEFLKLRESNRSILDKSLNSPLTIYLDAFYNYNTKDLKSLKENINVILNDLEDDERRKHSDWDFQDIKIAIKKNENTEIRKEFINLINILDGFLSKRQYNEN